MGGDHRIGDAGSNLVVLVLRPTHVCSDREVESAIDNHEKPHRGSIGQGFEYRRSHLHPRSWKGTKAEAGFSFRHPAILLGLFRQGALGAHAS